MSARRARQLVHSWETTRFELLNTRICDLRLTIARSPLERPVRRLRKELEDRRICFQPQFYLTDSWGCPNEVPVIGIPFYLADHRLRRIEEEQTGEIESELDIMGYLRHEAGHAINYAYRLWTRLDWTEVFGSFERRYRDHFQPEPHSRHFVRHLKSYGYGRNYAQKHPDEDFAETFAVWLTPRSRWRQKYAGWPALRKLQCVHTLMREIRGLPPLVYTGARIRPLSEMTELLIDHYGQRSNWYSEVAQGYVDDMLKDAFPSKATRHRVAIYRVIRKHREELVRLAVQWTGLDTSEVQVILEKLDERSRALALNVPNADSDRCLLKINAMLTGMAANFYHTGRLSA